MKYYRKRIVNCITDQVDEAYSTNTRIQRRFVLKYYQKINASSISEIAFSLSTRLYCQQGMVYEKAPLEHVGLEQVPNQTATEASRFESGSSKILRPFLVISGQILMVRLPLLYHHVVSIIHLPTILKRKSDYCTNWVHLHIH